MTNIRMNYTKIEEIIKARLEALEEAYELADWEVEGVRDQTYREGGWDGDPDAEEAKEAEDDSLWTCWTVEDELREIQMSWRDFL